MNQQQKNLKERVEQWAPANGFKCISIDEQEVQLERLSDGYQMPVNIRLLDHIMRDDQLLMVKESGNET